MGINLEDSSLDFVSGRGDEGGDEEEYMSWKDFITELHEVAKSYGSVKAMCTQSNRMRLDAGFDSDGLNILDAAIALQMCLQLKKKNAPDDVINAIKKVLLDNIKAISE